jgi:hypothetical protein
VAADCSRRAELYEERLIMAPRSIGNTPRQIARVGSTPLWLGAALASLLTTHSAGATLGGDHASISTVAARTSATLRVSRAERYSLHELSLPTRSIVREYLANDGTVFGVSWRGPWRPDLRLLLGKYYPEFLDAMRSRRMARGPVTIRLPGLVVELSGHQRAFYGRAYATDAVPAGTRAEDIR